MNCRLPFSIQFLVLLGAVLFLSACDSLSDAGNQDDLKPRASALVIGSAGITGHDSNRSYTVRAGSEVLLSGKDSDGLDDPLLQFSWRQTDNSGFEVELIERNESSRSFTAPLVAEITPLMFTLTVVDADGTQAVDVVTVSVIPVHDTDRFLVHPDAKSAKLTLLVAVNEGEVTGASIERFEVEITVLAHWRNRQGQYDSIVLPERGALLEGSFPAFYAATENSEDANNPRLEYSLPQVEVDDINRFFETSERERRLEIQDIDSVYYELELNLHALSTSVAFKIYAYDGAKYLAVNNLVSSTISGDTLRRTDQLAAASVSLEGDDRTAAILIDSNEGSMVARILVEELKQQIGADNVQSARDYYKLIDPNDDFVYLKDWLVYAGFGDAVGGLLSDSNVANAVYVNNYDLGFGRDMWTRVASSGDVYSYVVNYPNLESAVKKTGDFAVVVMEYSANPGLGGGSSQDNRPDKIVKFYTYVPDKKSGDYIRSNTINFDGRGEKPMPGVCTACHYQDPDTVGNTFVDESGNPDYSQADLDSTFLPWDLDSFLYSRVDDDNQIDPSYNSANVLQSNRTISSRQGQEAQFKKLNEAALATYLGDPERNRASIELLHCMYGDPDRLEVDSILPNDTFDSGCVQPGWVGQEALYHKVYARHCRACHTQFPTHESDADMEKDFDSYSDLISEDKIPLLKNYIYELGIMPLARLTMDRFWVEFRGDAPSAADFLKQHLESMGEQINTVPGQPVVKVQIEGSPDEIGDVVTLQGAGSLFSDTFNWTIAANGPLSDGACASVPAITNSENVSTKIVFDLDDYFPCVFDITLTTQNNRGLLSNSFTQQLTADRVPVANSFIVDLLTVDYQLGDDAIIINMIDNLSNLGDGGIAVIVNRAEEPFGLSVNDAVENVKDSAESLVYSFDALKGADGLFEYKVEDFNGSVSLAEGIVQLVIPEIKPVLAVDRVLTNSAVLSWTLPEGFPSTSNGAGVSYAVFIKEASDVSYPIAATITTELTAVTVEQLKVNTNYEVKVVVFYDGYLNDSDSVAMTTSPGVPLNLIATERAAFSVSLSWSPPSGVTSGCYKVYRDASVISGANCIGVVEYVDVAGLSSNSRYAYQVAAVGIGDVESITQRVVVQTAATPPMGLSAVAGISEVTLQWQDSNEGVRDFVVYRNGILRDTVIGVTGIPEVWIDSGLTSNTAYIYSVATRGDEDTLISNQVQINIETDVSYTDDIRTGPVANEGCIGCHFSHTESAVKSYFEERLCVTNTVNYAVCSSSMSGFSYSGEDFSLIRKWVADGMQ